MTHIAVREQDNGKMVEWMEKVGDEEYAAAVRAAAEATSPRSPVESE